MNRLCVNDTESAAGALQRAGEMAVGSLVSIQLQLFVLKPLQCPAQYRKAYAITAPWHGCKNK